MSRARLWDRVLALGLEHEHREADLFLRDNAAARALLAEYPTDADVVLAVADERGRRWLYVPHAYQPYWTSRPSFSYSARALPPSAAGKRTPEHIARTATFNYWDELDPDARSRLRARRKKP